MPQRLVGPGVPPPQGSQLIAPHESDSLGEELSFIPAGPLISLRLSVQAASALCGEGGGGIVRVK